MNVIEFKITKNYISHYNKEDLKNKSLFTSEKEWENLKSMMNGIIPNSYFSLNPVTEIFVFKEKECESPIRICSVLRQEYFKFKNIHKYKFPI